MVSFQDNETRLKRIAKHAHELILDIGYSQYPNTHLSGEVIGFFQSGLVGNREHCSVYIPRILNTVAEDAGLQLVTVEPATLFYIPFLTYQVIYVYRKVA